MITVGPAIQSSVADKLQPERLKSYTVERTALDGRKKIAAAQGDENGFLHIDWEADSENLPKIIGWQYEQDGQEISRENLDAETWESEKMHRIDGMRTII